MVEFLDVNEILAHLDLKESMTGAEFGCGSAAFTLALAKKLKKGRIYALDIQEEKLSALKGALAHENINNVVTVLCDLEVLGGSKISDNTVDVVLIPNVLFQAENKEAIVKEAVRILKPGGQLLIVDWLKQGPHSPKEGMVSPDQVKKIGQTLGLSLQKEFAAGDYHFALVFHKWKHFIRWKFTSFLHSVLVWYLQDLLLQMKLSVFPTLWAMWMTSLPLSRMLLLT